MVGSLRKKVPRILSVSEITATYIRFCGALLDRTDSDIVDRIIEARTDEILLGKEQNAVYVTSTFADHLTERLTVKRQRKTFQMCSDSVELLKTATQNYKRVGLKGVHEGIILDYFVREAFYRLFSSVTASDIESDIERIESLKSGTAPSYYSDEHTEWVKRLLVKPECA